MQGGTTANQVTYDALVVTATVTVTDNQQGQLVASVSYSGDTEFNNILPGEDDHNYHHHV